MIDHIDHEDVIETNFIGGGYGYTITELPEEPGVVQVVLINEDGLALAVLQNFHIGGPRPADAEKEEDLLQRFTSNLIASISAGHGDLILQSAQQNPVPMFEVVGELLVTDEATLEKQRTEH
jgi:hypothetical protein